MITTHFLKKCIKVPKIFDEVKNKQLTHKEAEELWMLQQQNIFMRGSMLFEDFNLEEVVMPPWFGLDKFHRSHRSNLLRKDYEYYSEYFDEPSNLEYYWPTKEVSNAN